MMSTAQTCGAAVRPPRMLIVLLATGIAIDWALGTLGLLPGVAIARSLAGLLTVAAGICLLVVCMRRFSGAGTNVPTILPTTALVTHGPYGWSRNPIYLALLAIYAGLALLAASPSALLLGMLGALVIHFGVVLREEQYLRHLFGQVYDDYCQRTRRWL